MIPLALELILAEVGLLVRVEVKTFTAVSVPGRTSLDDSTMSATTTVLNWSVNTVDSRVAVMHFDVVGMMMQRSCEITAVDIVDNTVLSIKMFWYHQNRIPIVDGPEPNPKFR